MSATPFDPDAAALPGSGLFGLSCTPEEARVHVFEVPFDATTSYRQGTAGGPAAVRAASHQVDLHDRLFGAPWRAGIHLVQDDGTIAEWNAEARRLAAPVIAAGGALAPGSAEDEGRARVDELGALVNARVREFTRAALDAGRVPAVLGGDHASPFGALAAAAAAYPGLGVLHFDAHADLRPAYEGFTWSHASIFHNVLERVPGVARLVQVGVRDLGQAEAARIDSDARIVTLFDDAWALARLRGADLRALVEQHVAELPREVWISFDVDGLAPDLCPNTGTPVPGGLDWHTAMLWLATLAASGRRVVGFDLCEVSPGPAGDPQGTSWDANVGARLLYRLCGAALATLDCG